MFLCYLSLCLDIGLGAKFFCFYFSHESVREFNYELKLDTWKLYFQILFLLFANITRGKTKKIICDPSKNWKRGAVVQNEDFLDSYSCPSRTSTGPSRHRATGDYTNYTLLKPALIRRITSCAYLFLKFHLVLYSEMCRHGCKQNTSFIHLRGKLGHLSHTVCAQWQGLWGSREAVSEVSYWPSLVPISQDLGLVSN